MSKKIQCEKCDGQMKKSSYKQDEGDVQGIFTLFGSVMSFGIGSVLALIAYAGVTKLNDPNYAPGAANGVRFFDYTPEGVAITAAVALFFFLVTFSSNKKEVAIQKCQDCGHFYEIK